jgi:phosphatidylinositol alpha-1,6-mannosyltransferase
LRQKIALVTSGLGTKYGGIGVVAESIKAALDPFCEVGVWQHPPFWPWLLRVSKLAAHAFVGSLRSPDLLIYDHLHLAVLHEILPTLRQVPYAVFLHGVEAWQPLSRSRRAALLDASLLIANSATTVSRARAANPWLPHVEVVWLGVSSTPNPSVVGQSRPVGLIVGRMSTAEQYKGHDAVLDAWPLILEAVPHAKLLIVGKGTDELRLRQRVQKEKLRTVEFCGRVSDTDRDLAYRSARLVFYVSTQEGFGLAGVEALSFGVPCMGLAGTVIEELFPNCEGVIIAKDSSKQSIAEAAIPIFGSAQLAARLGNAGRARVESTFLEQHFARRLRHALAPLIPSIERDQRNIPSPATPRQNSHGPTSLYRESV